MCDIFRLQESSPTDSEDLFVKQAGLDVRIQEPGFSTYFRHVLFFCTEPAAEVNRRKILHFGSLFLQDLEP